MTSDAICSKKNSDWLVTIWIFTGYGYPGYGGYYGGLGGYRGLYGGYGGLYH